VALSDFCLTFCPLVQMGVLPTGEKVRLCVTKQCLIHQSMDPWGEHDMIVLEEVTETGVVVPKDIPQAFSLKTRRQLRKSIS
jgi:hypothetical protein